jgi:hypothetical protein
MMEKLQEINEGIDMLFKLFNLASTAAMMNLKKTVGDRYSRAAESNGQHGDEHCDGGE